MTRFVAVNAMLLVVVVVVVSVVISVVGSVVGSVLIICTLLSLRRVAHRGVHFVVLGV
jgi:hypothetical protein